MDFLSSIDVLSRSLIETDYLQSSASMWSVYSFFCDAAAAAAASEKQGSCALAQINLFSVM